MNLSWQPFCSVNHVHTHWDGWGFLPVSGRHLNPRHPPQFLTALPVRAESYCRSKMDSLGTSGVRPRPSSPGRPVQSGQDTLFTSLQLRARRSDTASTASLAAFCASFHPSESPALISAVFSSETLSEECYTSIRHSGVRKKENLNWCCLFKTLKDFWGKGRKKIFFFYCFGLFRSELGCISRTGPESHLIEYQ